MKAVFDCVTIFPEMFVAVTEAGITRKALEEKRWDFQAWNLRDFADNAYRAVDDRPYGGGPGMLMMPGPLEKAILAAKDRQKKEGCLGSKVIYLSPQGRTLQHKKVMELAAETPLQGFVLLCGRYEGVDERVLSRCVDEEISVGDFVLSGGELPAMILMDAVIRQLPGVLGDAASAIEDSFADGLLDCPHYTRPEVYEDQSVPDVLLSGDHQKIRRWRLKQSLARTRARRPELFAQWVNRWKTQGVVGDQGGVQATVHLSNKARNKEITQLLAEISAEQCGEKTL
ncbi:MAG: tRNA ((1)-)-methyltransferase [Pseudomonadota bacterium]